MSEYQKELELAQVSSGMQAVIPMLLVLENKRTKLRIIKNCYVIEEPELNLFPGMQKKLTSNSHFRNFTLKIRVL